MVDLGFSGATSEESSKKESRSTSRGRSSRGSSSRKRQRSNSQKRQGSRRGRSSSSRRSRSQSRKSSRSGSRSRTRMSSRRSSQMSRGSRRSHSEIRRRRVIKERRRRKVQGARRKQMAVDCLRPFLMFLQLTSLVATVAAGSLMYGFIVEKFEGVYYLAQLALECLLLVITMLNICHCNSFFRICLLSGHLCAMVYSLFLIQFNIRTEYSVYCFGTTKCVWAWPLETRFHLVYLGAASFCLHLLLSLVTICLVIFYEGSEEHLKKLKSGVNGAEAKIIAHEIHAQRRRDLKRMIRSSRKRSSSYKRSKGSLGQSEKKNAKILFVLDDEGKTKGVGLSLTKSTTTLNETPEFVEKQINTVNNTKVVVRKGFGSSQKSVCNSSCGNSKKSATSPKIEEKKQEKPKTPDSMNASTATEPTKEKKAPKLFKSISKMPALESPIAYLNRKEKEFQGKKSSYAF